MKPLEDMGRYATVVVDPPWEFKTSDYISVRKGQPYETMTMDDIMALPISSVLVDNANVFVWTIQRVLPETFAILDHWGLTYRFTMVWHKNGGTQFYDGPKSNAEFIVVGGNGLANWQDTNDFQVAFCAPRRRHSAKPEKFYDLLRRVTPAPRLDIFGRRAIGGFDSWGLEAPTENHEPDMFQGVLVD